MAAYVMSYERCPYFNKVESCPGWYQEREEDTLYALNKVRCDLYLLPPCIECPKRVKEGV